MFDKLYNSLKVTLLSIEVSMLKPFSYKEAGVLGEITESSNVAEKIQDEPGGYCIMRKQGSVQEMKVGVKCQGDAGVNQKDFSMSKTEVSPATK